MSFRKLPGGKWADVCNRAKPLDSLKRWNDHFFWVDAFACRTSFPWNTSKSVSKDPFPKSSEFNAEYYATLVAYPASFYKYPEPFLCLIGISHNYTLDEDTYPQFLRENGEEMNLLSFIQTTDPTKVRVGERQRAEDEPKLLFDEGGSGNLAEQGDSASGGHGVGDSAEIVVEDNAEVRGEHIPTLPFVTSSVSATPEREDEVHTDSATGLNFRTIGAPQRFVISSDSSHHSGANIAEAELILLQLLKKIVESSVFGGDSSGGEADHTIGGFSDLTGSDFIVGGIRTVISPDTDLQKVYVPQ
ncbi:hypothetical protein Tco_1240440 [Tanacetum coccineum]